MIVLDTNVLSEAMKPTPDPAGRIFPFDSAAAREFALIVADRRIAGRPIEDFDAQIAAITRSRGMSLATRDVQDFESTGVQLVDPWQQP